ncbi:hypothetical protein SAY87_016081 [Trapa incisa]|uniref:Single-stranded DNA binding protein Ssb-like OB fold domain-containing protein n=2 Tax=Trapa TaxID=22665 RepID=A0AAN7LG83_TRANT|nr:hypothetical protein SAY87_016081 [Trapa incisa]KAK4785921.1 hypothetical protein SAY86_002610 [Trapa natans]
MAELSKSLVKKISDLRPLDSGITITVKVVDAKMVALKGRQVRISECLVGDETGLIVYVARNDQVDLMKEGSTVILRNAKIEMYRGSMRLAVDRWGRVEATEPAGFKVKEDSNLSLIEFEMVNVVE